MRKIGCFAFICCVTFLLFSVQPSSASSIVINEFLAFSGSDYPDGSPKDWIELYNRTNEIVQLQGYSLTDDIEGGRRWVFPAMTIGGHGYLRIWASGRNERSTDGYHTNFALSRGGESIGLFAPDGELVDSVLFGKQRIGVSYGRYPNGSDSWLYFTNPTPGRQNTGEKYFGIADPPLFSESGGFYPEPVAIQILSRRAGSEIRYTLDGSEPDKNSEMYSGPLRISETTPVRARAFYTNLLPSDVVTNTFFINQSYRIPVLAITTAPENLWDRRTGIYANSEEHGRAWERPASIEYFDTENSRMFAVDAGLRIHGGASRRRSEKHSFRLYFRADYGPKKLNAPFIPSTTVDSFDRIVLRGGYNDSWTHWDPGQREAATYTTDQLSRDLQIDMTRVGSHGFYAELYLNGEYWGVYNPCERIDDAFLESYYGGAEEEWDVISDDEVKDGDRAAWQELQRFVQRANFSDPQDYEELASMVDIEQITAYYIVNIWVQNYDWPHHNWYAGRARRPGGKWRFFCWDVEYSFGSGPQGFKFNQNTFQTAQSGSLLGTLFDKLLRSMEYRDYFEERLEYYLGTALSPEHVLARFDEHAEAIRPAIPYEAERWNPNRGLEDWDRAAERLRDFVRRRSEYVRRHVYGSRPTPTPTPTPKPTPRKITQTAWLPPEGDWDYVYDPDGGSPEDIAQDPGWSHANTHDRYDFQPENEEGKSLRSPAFVSDGEGGLAWRLYDPGTTAQDPYLVRSGANSLVTLNYDLGLCLKGTAAFRIRSRSFVDDFGGEIPFGYSDPGGFNTVGLTLNLTQSQYRNEPYAEPPVRTLPHGLWPVSSSGITLHSSFPDVLMWPNDGSVSSSAVPNAAGFVDEFWDHTKWHEYWIQYDFTPGGESTALYVDGDTTPKFGPVGKEFFAISDSHDQDIPEGNLVFRISLRSAAGAGGIEIDYIALKSGRALAPQTATDVKVWNLYRDK